MPRTDGKPAGWRFFDEHFWQRGDFLMCHECRKQTAKDAPAHARHSPFCPKREPGAVVRGPDLPPPSVEQVHPIDAVRWAMRAQPKPRARIRDAGYMAWIRSHLCVSCGAEDGIEAHHWGPRGVGQKCDDLLCVALCHGCHSTFHARNALPGQTKAETEVTLLRAQVRHLVEWIAEQKLARALDSAGEDL